MREGGTKLIFAGCVLGLAILTFLRPEAAKPANADATVITFSFWGGYEEWMMWRNVVDAFMEENPDIAVKIIYIPGNYDDKIRLLLAADSAPDCMMIQDEPFPGYARYGKFADLTEYAYGPACTIDWDRDFWPTAAESFLHKGRVMGVPVTGGNILVLYNREMFREFGVPYPEDHWTFDDFLAAAKALSRDTDGDGRQDTFGLALPHWIYFLPWTWGFDIDYLNESHTDWVFRGPRALEATRFYQDLRWKHRVAPSVYDMPVEQEGVMFMTGRIGMMAGGPWTGLGFLTAGIDFDVAHMPVGPNGERATRVSWDCLSMFANSKHKEETWRFMEFCAGPRGQAIVGRSYRSIPALYAARDAFTDPDNGWSEEKFVEALEYCRLQPISHHWDKMRQIMDKEYELLLLNKRTPEEAIAAMDKAMRDQGVFPIEDEE